MYIQDPTLASAFYEAEKEYTEQVENEILARYKELQECGFSENEALERTKGAEGERYKRFLKNFVWDYQRRYREENGRTYSADHGKRTVFNADERNELQKEYKEYVTKLLQG